MYEAEERKQTHPERVQTPVAALSHQPQDRAEVVREHRRAEPRDVAQARRLEDVLLLREQLARAVRVARGDRVRVDVEPALVQLEDLVRDVLQPGSYAYRE